MNIIVVLRAVQDPAGLMFNRRAEKVFVNRESYRLNPSDHNALEAALSAAGDAHSVIAVSYGGAPAEDVLRDALAAGAARALWIKDARLQTADAAVVTQALRCAREYVGGAALTVMGADVLDADLAQVAPRLAAACDGTFVGEAFDARLAESGTVQVVVKRGDGYQWVESNSPVVAAIRRDSNRPRFAPAAQIISVYSTLEAVEEVSLETLGVSEAELRPATERRGESFPAERVLGEVLDGTEEETARQVAKELRRVGP